MANDTRGPGLTGQVVLRDVTDDDLPVFFHQQLDPAANYMAAFTAKDPTDRDAFAAHWAKIRADSTVTMKTVVAGGQVAGYVGSFLWEGKPQVCYWLGKEYWGKGLATGALSGFLGYLKVRPLYASAAGDNAASIRVLEKCGFRVTGYEKGFANARGAEIEEAMLELK